MTSNNRKFFLTQKVTGRLNKLKEFLGSYYADAGIFP